MNKLLRQSFGANSWSQTEGFLVYLRGRGAFSHMSGNHESDVNPYWWGAIYNYDVGAKELKDIVENKSLKLSRLKFIVEQLKEDSLSPIVMIVGLHLERELIKYN